MRVRVFVTFTGLMHLADLCHAQIVSPPQRPAHCGPAIKKDDVLVLDLEGFGDDTEAAQAFIAKHVTGLEVKSEEAEVIRTRTRNSRRDRMDAMQRSQKEAASRGCNVVLVLRAWAGEDSAAYAMPAPSGPGAFAIGLHYAYARVLLGVGDH